VIDFELWDHGPLMKPMRPRSLRVGLALAFSILASPSVGFAQQATRAYVLDTGARALVSLELPSGKRLGSLALAGAPWVMVQSPDGSRLVVLDRGPGLIHSYLRAVTYCAAARQAFERMGAWLRTVCAA